MRRVRQRASKKYTVRAVGRAAFAPSSGGGGGPFYLKKANGTDFLLKVDGTSKIVRP